jgi:hypothetical protein
LAAYPSSVSLPGFIWDEVLNNGFGDDDEELIEAVQDSAPTGLLATKASEVWVLMSQSVTGINTARYSL